jgi:preprotein translocase subunit SecD
MHPTRFPRRPCRWRRSVSVEDLDKAASIVRNRLGKLGVSGDVVVRPATHLLVVSLYWAHRPAPMPASAVQPTVRLIGKTAQLMVFDFEQDLAPPSRDGRGDPVARASLYSLLKPVQARTAAGPPGGYYLFHGAGHKLVAGSPTLKDLLRPFGGHVPARGEVLRVPPHTLVVSCAAATGCLGATAASRHGTYYYLMQFYPMGEGSYGTIPEMGGADLVLSGTRADFAAAGEPVVLLQFTNHGSSQFEKITREEARRGQQRYDAAGLQDDYLNYVQHFAIVLDQQLASAPYIDFKRNPRGIPGPNAEIDLGQGGSIEEAKHLALLLQTGTLPFGFEQVSQRVIR